MILNAISVVGGVVGRETEDGSDGCDTEDGGNGDRF